MGENSYPKKVKQIDKDFYERVKKRKNRLVKQFLAAPRDVVTSFTPKHKHMDNFLKEAEHFAGKHEMRADCQEYWIEMKMKGETGYLPFLCFQQFEIFYTMSRSVERLAFFEIYFSGGILSVLMRKSRYANGNEGFAEFDMNRREWSMAKAQMTLWQAFLRPEIDILKHLSVPQEVLLEYFSHGSDSELTSLLKRAAIKQRKIEEKKEQAENEFLGKKEKQKNKEKRDELKKERDELLSEWEAATDQRVQELSGFEQFGTVWPIISYVTMIGAAPLLEESYSPQFLLNICVAGQAEEIAPALQKLLADFALHSNGILAESVRINHARRGAPSQHEEHLPQILLYEKREQLGSVYQALEERMNLLRDENVEELFAEEMPTLLGTTWISDGRVANFTVSSEELYAATQENRHLTALRELIDGNLYHDVSLKWDRSKIVAELDEEEVEEQWEKYGKRLGKALRDAWNLWNTWWKEQNIVMLSPQYINLAAWASVLLSNDVEADLKSGTGLIADIRNSVLRMEEELVGRLDVLKSLSRRIVEERADFTTDRPNGEQEAKLLEKPFLMTVSENGEQKECVVFTKALFSSYVKKAAAGVDPEKIIELAYRKKLLCTNSAKGDRTKTVKLGKRSDESGRDYSERCYAFDLNGMEKYMKS